MKWGKLSMMPEGSKKEVTALLLAWRGGEAAALGQLMPQLYGQLKRMASGYLRRERQDHTLQTTALVHEAYLRLIELNRVSWKDRAHFLAISAQIMRRVLVDHARHHGRAKRGSNAGKVSIEEVYDLPLERAPDLVELDEALRDLAVRDSETARIVEMRYFGGLNREEIAEVLGTSSATVTRRWRMARAWLFQALSRQNDSSSVENAAARPPLGA